MTTLLVILMVITSFLAGYLWKSLGVAQKELYAVLRSQELDRRNQELDRRIEQDKKNPKSVFSSPRPVTTSATEHCIHGWPRNTCEICEEANP